MVPDLRDAKGIADVAVLAVPPAVVGEMLGYAQECAVADVVHRRRQREGAAGRGRPASSAATWRPTFPRIRWRAAERHGPAAAQADLFLGRTWALCPLPETSAPTRSAR